MTIKLQQPLLPPGIALSLSAGSFCLLSNSKLKVKNSGSRLHLIVNVIERQSGSLLYSAPKFTDLSQTVN